ncbi:MAG: hypothetical protein LBT17_02540 [Mycoplasmataceae bacterium]|nr:hypothetical protein [Mycoplasmataceae bacterium]
MPSNTNPMVELNEIPTTVDPKSVVHTKAILAVVWSAVSLYLVILIIALILNSIYDSKPTESWEKPFAIALLVFRYLIGFALIFAFILLQKSKKNKLIITILLVASITTIFVLETIVAIVDFGNILDETNGESVSLWASIINGLTAFALVLATSASILITFLLKAPKKVTLPESTHERIL